MKKRQAEPEPTDRQRFDAVFAGLMSARVAYCFDLRGSTGVREDRYNDYMKVAELNRTDLWVGEHVGNTDDGGARWGAGGILYVATRPHGLPWEDVTWVPSRELCWSFNHEHPELAEFLVALFQQQGIDASWSGDPWDCVIVNLETARGPVQPEQPSLPVSREVAIQG
jgi:hypothetical protein